MDEHRIGLKPLVSPVWASPGYRPTVIVHHRYQWLYVYGFVQPSTGRNFWLLMPTVSILAFNLALAEFATFIGPHTTVRLVVDCAGWHTSPHVIHLPTSCNYCFSLLIRPNCSLLNIFGVSLTNRFAIAISQVWMNLRLFKLNAVLGSKTILISSVPPLTSIGGPKPLNLYCFPESRITCWWCQSI